MRTVHKGLKAIDLDDGSKYLITKWSYKCGPRGNRGTAFDWRVVYYPVVGDHVVVGEKPTLKLAVELAKKHQGEGHGIVR